MRTRLRRGSDVKWTDRGSRGRRDATQRQGREKERQKTLFHRKRHLASSLSDLGLGIHAAIALGQDGLNRPRNETNCIIYTCACLFDDHLGTSCSLTWPWKLVWTNSIKSWRHAVHVYLFRVYYTQMPLVERNSKILKKAYAHFSCMVSLAVTLKLNELKIVRQWNPVFWGEPCFGLPTTFFFCSSCIFQRCWKI